MIFTIAAVIWYLLELLTDRVRVDRNAPNADPDQATEDFFVLRMPIIINSNQVVIELHDGNVTLNFLSMTGVCVKVLETSLLQAVSPVLSKHGVCQVDSVYCEQAALMFCIKFHSKLQLEQFLTEKETIQKSLAATITNLCKSELDKGKKQCSSVEFEAITVDADVLLVSPSHTTDYSTPQVVGVNLGNYHSISRMFSFDSNMFADQNTIEGAEHEEAKLKDLQVELMDVLNWFSLGVQLKIPPHFLQAIRQDYKTTEQCRLEMLIRWGQLEKPTWSNLVSALVNIGRNKLANSLAQKYGLPMPFHEVTAIDSDCVEVAQTEQTLSDATNELNEAKESHVHINQLVEQVAEKEVPFLKEKVKSLIVETEIVKAQLEHRNKELELFKKLVPSVKYDELQLLSGVLKEKSEQIESLQDKLSTNETELTETKKQLGEKETELAEMKEELSTKSARVRELEKEVEQINRLFKHQQEEMNKKSIEETSTTINSLQPVTQPSHADRLAMHGSGQIIEMACLGRPFRLGMLYDCRSDKLIPGITLWDDERLKSELDSREQVDSDFEVIAEDSLESKASNLNISASLKLSYIGGLVQVSGSAKYLDDRKSSKHQSRVSLKYWSTSRFDQLTMEQLGNVQSSDVLSKKIATHVVAGVLYGADAFFVFDQKIEDSENECNVKGKLEVLVKAIPEITEMDLKDNADLFINVDEKKPANKIECKFHGDLQLPKNPATFQEAVQVFHYLLNLPKGDDGPRVVPKKVWLHPLSNLSSEAAKVVHQISTSLASQAQKVMEELLDYEMQCNDLMNTQVCSSFSGLQTQLSRFKGMILQYRLEFSKKLTHLLPTIREGAMEEAQLADVFKSKEASPFSAHQLKTWLQMKENEVKVLSKYFQSLQEISCIGFALMEEDLDEVVNDLNYDHVVCFSFQILTSSDVSLNQMQTFLDTQTSSTPPQKSTPWFKNKQIIATMRKHVRQFKTFAKANGDRDRIKFVVADNSDESSDEGTAILLFEDGISEEFDPPVSPDHVKPAKDGVTHSSILLEWSKPEYGSDCVQRYTVCYGLKEEPADQWKSMTTTSQEIYITIDGLQPAKSYSAKVRAECDAGVSEYSKVSDPILTQPSRADRLAVTLRDKSTPIPQESGPPVYKLVGQEIDLPGKMLHKVSIGEPTPGVPEKVLLMVGAIGTGKSTLINGMINYIQGVRWKDDFRFKLITEEAKSQAHSQTRVITAYTIHHMEGSRVDYNLTVIDTPGFGDISGLKRDNMITEQIKEFFSVTGRNGITHLDGVGFVTQSALARLTPTQLYIFDSILSIFGKDVAKNIFIMVTFADGQKPPVMSAIEAVKIPCSGFFKFNNSALFAENTDDDEDNFDEMFWRMGVNSFKKFFTAFQTAESVSLTMTKEVLDQRKRLQTIIIGLQQQMQACLAEVEVLRQERIVLKTYEADIIANRDFSFEIKVPVYTEEPVSNTSQLSYRVEKKIHDDLKKRFQAASTGKKAVEEMIASHQRQLEEAHAQLHEMVDEARLCLMKLDEIALKPNPLTQVEYIQLLINSEKRQAKEGWLERVNYLETTKRQAKLLAVMKDAHDIDRRIKEEEEKKAPGWEETVDALNQVKQIQSTVESIKKERESKGFFSGLYDKAKAAAKASVVEYKQ